ncbi:MAG: S8 family peptidase, partial [Actinomycetota bacterium]
MRAGVKVGVAVAVAAGLTACGGGGGGAGGGGGYGAPPVTGNLPRAGSGGSGVRSGAPDYGAELGRNWGLATIGANPDAAGQIGTGVTVGIVDTGIDLTHPDFTGAISPDSVDIITGTYANVADQGGHGTSVAGVIGARRDGYDGVGVAPGSTLLAVRADSPGSCLAGSCTFYHSDLALATDYAVAHGARILNYSLGGSGMDQSFIDALNNAFSHHTVVVAAAGNAQGADPIDPAKWAAVNGNGLGLAVGAIDSSGALAWFSNQAGVAKDHFLVAPGQNITTTANGGGTHTVSGTSFASPHVAGAAAVVWGASPFLTGEQVVSILLNSATDLGAPGVDDVYGHGLLNLPAALQPQGTLSIPTGATVAQGGAALSATSLSLGGAFGDAMSRATPLSRATVFDAYGRPYRADLSGAVQAPAPQRDLSGWLAASGETATMAMGETASMTLSTPPEPMHEGPRQRPGDDRAPPRFALSAEVGGNSLSMARGFGLDNFTGLAASAPATALEFPTGSPLATPFLGLAGDGNSVTAGRALGDGVGIRFGFSHDDGTATL